MVLYHAFKTYPPLHMIKSKKDLSFYLVEDLKRFEKKPTLKDWFLYNEAWYIYRYIKNLRFLEYYKNSDPNLLRKILFYLHFYRYKKQVFKLKIDIKPNNLGPGFRLYHLGSLVRVKQNCIIGKNCTMLPGVVIGNKNLENDNTWVIIGDNCYLGLGVKIFGQVTIGNNVTIGANSVVTKDIPDNCVVSGIPAKIIKQNGIKIK